MPRREDDDVARGTARPNVRVLAQAGGFLLAGAATLAVFLTDDAQLLRLAVVAVAWAFVLATLAAGRRGADGGQAAAREADLRMAYERELEREVAARREFELSLEDELRREAEGSMRTELDAIRREIASLADLRDEVARVASLRGDIIALGGLREEVARVAALRDDVAGLAALRDDVAGLASLRGELGQLAALREDVGRLRAELAEQLSSEMLVERIVMRTQASRLPGDLPRVDGSARTMKGDADRGDDLPPRELTGGWPAIRLEESRVTQQFEQVHSSSWQPVAPPTTSSFAAAAAAPLTPMPDRSAVPALPRPVAAPAPPTVVPVSLPVAVEAPGVTASEPQPSYPIDDRYAEPPLAPAAPRRQVPSAFDRHARASAHDADPFLGSSWTRSAPVAPPTVASPVVTPSPVLPPAPVPPERPAAWSPPPEPDTDALDDGPRRRRTDEPPARPLPAASALTAEYPPASSRRSDPQPADSAGGPGSSDPLARILAENGGAQPSGRRRRRYREDDESDDVLARVLGRD